MKIDGKLQATEEDKQPNVNIKPFGSCSLKNGNACVPAPTVWKDTSVFEIDGKKELLDSSTCQCSVGGKISVIKSAQHFVEEGGESIYMEHGGMEERNEDTEGTQTKNDEKQKVEKYVNPDIAKFEAALAKAKKDLAITKQKYVDYYKKIGKIPNKPTSGDIEKALSPENKNELNRIQGSITTNNQLLSEAKIIQNQWNKLDTDIEDVVDEYNKLEGLKGKNRLDPNLLKALMFSETEMGAGKDYKALVKSVPTSNPNARYQLNLGRVTDGNMYNAVKKEFNISVDWRTNYIDNGNINDVKLAAGALFLKKKVGVSSKNNNAWFNAVKAYKGNSEEGERKANKVWKLFTTGIIAKMKCTFLKNEMYMF
jgi:hypothetical protein